jgi:hypothetical protein
MRRQWVLLPLVLFRVCATSAAQDAASRDLGVKYVRVETVEVRPGLDWKNKPGLYPVTRYLASDRVVYPYSRAESGKLEPDAGAVIGCVGGPYGADVSFVPTSFTQAGNTFRIVLEARTEPKAGGGAPRMVYFAAYLPTHLPDGKYAVECVVREKRDAAEPRVLRCTFDVPSPAAVKSKGHAAALKAMSAEELVGAYVEAGTALRGTAIGPMDNPPIGRSGFDFDDPRYYAFYRTRREIMQRGAAAVPALIELLRTEVVRNPTLGPDDGFGFGFARNVMELLAQVGDPHPVPLLVEVLDGSGGSANIYLRAKAMETLERLTLVRFIRYKPHHGGYARAIEHPEAVPDERPSDPARAKVFSGHAARYRAWLAGEGKNTSKWLELARHRARETLATDDLPAVYNTVTFLQAVPGRDDDPVKTAARVAEVLAEARLRYSDEYEHRGRPLPVTVGNWTHLLAHYGPGARPHVKTLIRVAGETPEGSWGFVRNVAQVGGEAAMAWLVAQLPAERARLREADVDPGAHWDDVSGPRKRDRLIRYQIIRHGVHRWAGRTFADEEAILAWWRDNQGKSQEQWLREGLEVTAARADAGDGESQYLLRLLLPDLPRPGPERRSAPPPVSYGPEAPPPQTKSAPFRVEWLKANRPRLRYAEDAGGFVLAAD